MGLGKFVGKIVGGAAGFALGGLPGLALGGLIGHGLLDAQGMSIDTSGLSRIAAIQEANASRIREMQERADIRNEEADIALQRRRRTLSANAIGPQTLWKGTGWLGVSAGRAGTQGIGIV